jgi:hypothetical protein
LIEMEKDVLAFVAATIALVAAALLAGCSGSSEYAASSAASSPTISVERWFENADRTSCRAWDSSYGRNYRFDLR